MIVLNSDYHSVIYHAFYCSTCTFGVQPRDLRPPGWPFPASTDVFVLSSSSGRAALNNEERKAPYVELGGLFHSLPWLDNETIDGLEVEQSRKTFVSSAASPSAIMV